MPIYEYQCQSCGHELEALQKISDNLLINCPACDKTELKKLVSASAFRLSGSGWYETDFKSGNRKNLVGAAESGSKGSSSTAEGTSDAKGTESKAETKQAGTSSAA